MEYLRRDEDFLTVLHKLRLGLSLLQSSTVGRDECFEVRLVRLVWAWDP